MSPSNAPRPAALGNDLHNIGQSTQHAMQNKQIELISRLGLVIRGIVYFVPGVLAVRWAMGQNQRSMSQSSAIDLIGQQPMGRAMLVVVAIGLAGYAMWGLVRAIFDPQGRGHAPTGIAQRFGYAMSAVAYLSLFYATVLLLTGGMSRVEQHQDMTFGLLARPFGAVIVVIIGLCWIFGSGIAQILVGWRREFERDLAVDQMSRSQRRWVLGFGRVGLIGRGTVFTVIGGLLVAIGLHLHASSNAGLDGALLELAHQPFGRALLAAAGLGLMAFGVYSAMCARWMRMHQNTGSAVPSPR